MCILFSRLFVTRIQDSVWHSLPKAAGNFDSLVWGRKLRPGFEFPGKSRLRRHLGENLPGKKNWKKSISLKVVKWKNCWLLKEREKALTFRQKGAVCMAYDTWFAAAFSNNKTTISKAPPTFFRFEKRSIWLRFQSTLIVPDQITPPQCAVYLALW